MSNELDKLRQAFESEGEIKPTPERKEASINAALAEFSKINSTAHQGMAADNRLSKRGFNFANKLRERIHAMTSTRQLKMMLAGGTTLSALAVITLILPNVGFNPRTDFAEEASYDLADSASEVKVEQLLSSPTTGVGQLALEAPAASTKRLRSVERELSKAYQQVDDIAVRPALQGNDRFSRYDQSPVQLVLENPVTTFSVDVDTASYAFVRGALNDGSLPPRDAVRIEEMINYFDYQYQAPDNPNEPFATNVTIVPSPWNDQTQLMHVAIKGYELAASETPPANLVFLIDTSGSMNEPNKLPLLRNAFKLLLGQLKATDTISIVTYAGSAGTVLAPTPASNQAEIMAAIENLTPGGSTAGAEGIRRAYQLAESSMIEGGTNRVILATDGDFNVGITDPEQLKNFVEVKRDAGVSLSVLGFGRGNYNDELMQSLAQNGNGNAAYIDTLNEARKVLVEQVSSTLFSIAYDVKLQIEFNPAQVSAYRQIGYETRQLRREEFNNDKIDAGEIGSGHMVTAIYELTPATATDQPVDALRFQPEATTTNSQLSDDLGFLKLRYKLPGETQSKLWEQAISSHQVVDDLTAASDDIRFSAAVAGLGQLLKGGNHTGDYTYDDVATLARSGRGDDRHGYRAEFINLVELAKHAAALEPLNK
jgi:Ca-activated chloride channel family protein